MAILSDRGIFWKDNDVVPENHFAPPFAVVGSLTINNDGSALLDLDGILSASDNPLGALLNDIPEANRIIAIRGKLRDTNKFVYLSKLCKSGGKFQSAGICHECWTANACLVGTSPFPAHPWEPKSPSLSIELTGYEEWLGLNSIELQSDWDNNSEVRVSYAQPENLTFSNGTFSITIKYDLYRSTVFRRTSNFRIGQAATLLLEESNGLSLDEALEAYEQAWGFFLLLTGCERNLAWPALAIGPSEESYIFYHSISVVDEQPPQSRAFWVTFTSIRDQLGEIFFAWRKLRSTMGPGAYLYLGIRRGLAMYVEHVYVNLIWGLESFHRKKFGDEIINPALETKIRRILSCISIKEDRKWVERILNNSLSPTLKDRLLQTLISLPIPLDETHMSTFAADCAARRNDLSHVGGSRRGVASYPDFQRDIEARIAVLSLLYHALLLQEIGVSASLVRQSLLSTFRQHEVETTLGKFKLLAVHRIESRVS